MKCLIDRNFDQSKTSGQMVVMTSHDVLPEGSDIPVKIVEKKVVRCEDYAGSLDMPITSDYKLETMLRNGIVPEEVPCSGLLDSQDPTDLQNQGLGAAGFDKLAGIVDSVPASEPEPAPASDSVNE